MRRLVLGYLDGFILGRSLVALTKSRLSPVNLVKAVSQKCANALNNSREMNAKLFDKNLIK